MSITRDQRPASAQGGLLLALTVVLLTPWLIHPTWSLTDEEFWFRCCAAWHTALLKFNPYEFLAVVSGGDRSRRSSFLFDWLRWLTCGHSAFAYHVWNIPLFFVPALLLLFCVRRITRSADAGLVAGAAFLIWSGGVDHLYQWAPLESRVFLFLSLLGASIVALAHRLARGRSSQVWPAIACVAAVAVAWSKENAGVVSIALVAGAFLVLRLRPIPDPSANRRFSFALGAAGLSAFLAAIFLHATRILVMRATGAAVRPTYGKTFVDFSGIPVALGKYLDVLWNCGGPLLLLPMAAAVWVAWRTFRRPATPWPNGFWILFFSVHFACLLAALLPWHMTTGKYLNPAVWPLCAALGIFWAAVSRLVTLRPWLYAAFALYLAVNGFRIAHAARWLAVRDETVAEVLTFLQSNWINRPDRGYLFLATEGRLTPAVGFENQLRMFYGDLRPEDPESPAHPGSKDWIIYPTAGPLGHMMSASFSDNFGRTDDPATLFRGAHPIFQTASAWTSTTVYLDAPLFNLLKTLPLPRVHGTMDPRSPRRIVDQITFRREWRIYRTADLPPDWDPSVFKRNP